MARGDEEQVTRMVRGFLDAVSRGDRKAILAHHAEDLLMFDFPDTVRGLGEYDRTWDFFFESQRGPITFEPEEFLATVGDPVAFVSSIVHGDGTTGGVVPLPADSRARHAVKVTEPGSSSALSR
jgi:ketosteroid isomerase-like protein